MSEGENDIGDRNEHVEGLRLINRALGKVADSALVAFETQDEFDQLVAVVPVRGEKGHSGKFSLGFLTDKAFQVDAKGILPNEFNLRILRLIGAIDVEGEGA